MARNFLGNFPANPKIGELIQFVSEVRTIQPKNSENNEKILWNGNYGKNFLKICVYLARLSFFPEIPPIRSLFTSGNLLKVKPEFLMEWKAHQDVSVA